MSATEKLRAKAPSRPRKRPSKSSSGVAREIILAFTQILPLLLPPRLSPRAREDVVDLVSEGRWSDLSTKV